MIVLDKDSLIVTFATSLGGLDLIQEHNKLTSCFCDDGGNYLRKYELEFDVFYEKHLTQLNALKDSKVAESDVNSTIMAYACELSLHELIEKYKLLPEQLTNDEGQYLDEYQGEFDEQYDNYLDQLTQISQSPLQNEMDEMWGEYVVKNGVEPLYVDCRIREDGSSPEDKNVIIKLSLDKENKVSIDDNTFCHCNSLDELKLLAVKSDEDFVIIEIHSFQYEP